MLNKLDSSAQHLLADHYDENSNYYHKVHPLEVAHTFVADPNKQPLLYHYTDLKSLKALDIKPNMINTVIVSHRLEGEINNIHQMLQSYGFNNTNVRLTDLLY